MKLQKITFTYLILFITLQVCLGQEKFSPNLLASIHPHNCEYVLQHVDSLIDEVEKSPNSIGYIVINRAREKSKQFNRGGFYYEDIISVQIKNRNLIQQRIRIIRSESEKYKIDFYKAPNASIKPDFNEVRWDFQIPSKPVLFDEGYGGQLCDETFYSLKTFSEILVNNPNIFGHFVIYAESIKDFPKEKARITNEILKVGIPLNRFKFFFRKDSSTIEQNAKLWLVPKKGK